MTDNSYTCSTGGKHTPNEYVEIKGSMLAPPPIVRATFPAIEERLERIEADILKLKTVVITNTICILILFVALALGLI